VRTGTVDRVKNRVNGPIFTFNDKLRNNKLRNTKGVQIFPKGAVGISNFDNDSRPIMAHIIFNA
jgi:hypothetical protein